MNKDPNQNELVKKIEKMEASRNSWKAKNKERYEDIKALKMRLKETQDSRDRWKDDYNKSEKSLNELKQIQEKSEAAISELKKELEDLKKENPQLRSQNSRAHYYPILLILACLRLLLHAAIPFRGLSESLKILNIGYHYSIDKTPSHSTIRRWVNRVGLYQLLKKKEWADDWFYIVDNSVRIENRKLCLILGVRLSKLNQEGYLTFTDLEILELGLIQGKATIGVTALLESAISKTSVPVGICSDQGPDVVPAIRLIISKHSKIKHIPDTIHATSNLLKNILENKTRWEEFCTKVSLTKNKLKQSLHSALCPPQIRGKSRFLNCSVIVDWAIKIIKLLESEACDEEMKIKLGWLIDYKKDVIEFVEMIKVVQLTNELVRRYRITSNTWSIARTLLKEEITSKKGKELVNKIVSFLKKISKLAGKKFLIGSSEILESAFGKLKSLDRECGNSGFTSSILGVGACFSKLDYATISEAMESVSNNDVNKWKIKIIGETQQSKRRKLLKSKKKEDLKVKLNQILEEKNKNGTRLKTKLTRILEREIMVA